MKNICFAVVVGKSAVNKEFSDEIEDLRKVRREMIKAVFFDIDGTLFSHKSMRVPQSTKDALKRLRAKGIKTFIATGRCLAEMKGLPIEADEYDGMVLLNGQICINRDGEVIYESPIEEADLKHLINAFEEKNIPVLLIEKEQIYINYVDEIVLEAQKTFSLPAPEVGKYEGAKIYQACIYANEYQEKVLMEKLQTCKSTRWNEYGIDLLSKNGGKDIGIQKVLEYYGIKRQESMAFGDGENDVDMLKFAGIGIAMGNAADVTKECADYVTTDIDKDGIYDALKLFEVI